MLNQILTFGVLPSIIGAIIWHWILILHKRLTEYRADYTGWWKVEIFGENGQVVKEDRLKLRQFHEVLSGTIERQKPIEQDHRQWRFEGRIKGDNFFAIFWPIDQSVVSYGCWYVHQRSDNYFEGHYLKIAEQGAVATIPLRITRAAPKKRGFKNLARKIWNGIRSRFQFHEVHKS